MNGEDEGLRVSVSMSRKVNLGNYQSADVFVAVSNLEVGATPEQIAEALETGDVAFGLVKNAVAEKIAGIQDQKRDAMARATASQQARKEGP